MSKNVNGVSNQELVKAFTDAMIKFGVIAMIVVLCVQVFAPFLTVMLWALILAVALYPLNLMLSKKLGGKPGRAATIIALSGILLIGTPAVTVGNSFAGYLHTVYTEFSEGRLEIDPPEASVADWPIVGEKVYTAWSSAADDLPAFVESESPQLKALSTRAIGVAKSTAGALFMFIGALIIAGIMMAYGESGTVAMRNIFERFTNPAKGIELQKLSVGTIRSVATGVIGVALIQSLLLGVGFVFAGIPAAGVLAVIVLVLGILQLPAALVSLPAIAYLWMSGDASTTSNIIWTAYLVIAGLADNVLKPILLGRGVDAPMPVVLLGALGGMVVAGIIGLFLGAVLLTLGYQIFMDWVGNPEQEELDAQAAAKE